MTSSMTACLSITQQVCVGHLQLSASLVYHLKVYVTEKLPVSSYQVISWELVSV